MNEKTKEILEDMLKEIETLPKAEQLKYLSQIIGDFTSYLKSSSMSFYRPY